MITLEVNGIEYSNFDSIEVGQSLDAVSGTFRFVAFTDGTNPFPFAIDDPCRVLVDETPVITGFIDKNEIEYDDKSHAIIIQGRDKTADVIDSTLGDDVEFNTPITLVGVIEAVLKVAKITDIKVIDEVGDIDLFESSEKISGEIGVGVFELIEGYCRKRQVLLTSNGDGDLVITQGQGVNVGFTLINEAASPELNNIKGARVIYNNTDRFNEYIVKSQGNNSASLLSGVPSNSEVTNASGVATDSAIRPSRILYQLAEKSSSSDQCATRATWQANINRARGFSYLATVQGHKDEATGLIWQVNKLIGVRDEYAGLSGKFLINSVNYKLTLNGGSITTLGIVAKDAYTLQASEPVEQEETSKTGLF
jgi:prophage tail gpP-like protein